MDRDDRLRLKAAVDELATLGDRADRIMTARKVIEAEAVGAAATLAARLRAVPTNGSVAWDVLTLHTNDSGLARNVALATAQPAIPDTLRDWLAVIARDAPALVSTAAAALGGRRFLSGAHTRAAGDEAARRAEDLRAAAVAAHVPAWLDHLENAAARKVWVSPIDALADRVGLTSRVSALARDHEVVTAADVRGLRDGLATLTSLAAAAASARKAAVRAGEAIKDAEARRLVGQMPVARLREATKDRLRTAPLADAGISTVLSVLDNAERLSSVPGIGPASADRAVGAARTLFELTRDELPVRIDIDKRETLTTTLLKNLRQWDAIRRSQRAFDTRPDVDVLRAAVSAVGSVDVCFVFARRRSLAEFRRAAADVRAVAGTHAPGAGSSGPWEDFLARPADYFALLAELGFAAEDEAKAHGDLPAEIVEAVRALKLDTQYLTASLRGYQGFAARFALVQRKVLIGDEMGLGKTVEALAVLAHLRAKGQQHALVVCPAAVVTNWTREVSAKSSLRPLRLHGPDRGRALHEWQRRGGVGVTTFETLRWMDEQLRRWPDVGCVVVDEAHYIKNPTALRSGRVRRRIEAAPIGVLLTGTPLENRIDEFRTLIGYLRPDLVVATDEFNPRTFRRQVAPAYLRRNQEDVLSELPEVVSTDEWVPMSAQDSNRYAEAVRAGNFMAMRQAAMVGAEHAAKMERLVEIVSEAEANGRRVLVFSHFLAVLEAVVRALPGEVFGPLTGAVPAARRQVMVDEFAAAPGGAALVAQIVAGGVGLNIQAASVVIICEPQLKPTTEWQAVARARRMGQLRSVQVHRLLSDEGADVRITEILARKTKIFEDFARSSDTAQSAPEAVDVSEADLAREVIAAERERLLRPAASGD